MSIYIGSLLTEKEIVRRPGEGDGGGVAYGGVGCVLHCAIGLYVANYLVRCVLDGAVGLDVAYDFVGCVLDGAVGF